MTGKVLEPFPGMAGRLLTTLDPALAQAVCAAIAAERVPVDKDVTVPVWASWAPGPALATAIADLDPTTLDDAGQIELIAAYERLAGWVHASQAVAMAGFAAARPVRDPVGDSAAAEDRRAWADHGFRDFDAVSEFAPAEISVRLGVAPGTAANRLADALELTTKLPATLTALAAGAISPRKATTILRAARDLPQDEHRLQLQTRLLPTASRRTPRQLESAAKRAVMTLDPATAAARAAAAKATRRVELYPDSDAMATLRSVGPADAALAIYCCLDLLARHGVAPGDDRTMDQRRFDALTYLVTTHPAITGECPCADAWDHTHDGTDSAEPLPDLAVELGFPRQRARGVGVGASGRRRALVQLTVSAETLLGVSDQPGWLAGYGPIPSPVAAAIAADANWTRLLTDPITGAVLAMDTDAHDPPTAMAALVAARDQTCRFPTCTHPARTCDLDHGRPWPRGRTTPAELLCECRPHHRLKHLAGWTLTRIDGNWTWITPTGHHYRLDPVTVGHTLDLINRHDTGIRLTDQVPADV